MHVHLELPAVERSPARRRHSRSLPSKHLARTADNLSSTAMHAISCVADAEAKAAADAARLATAAADLVFWASVGDDAKVAP